MARQQSHGKCYLCNKDFAKAAMSRHLAKCVKEHPAGGTAVAKSKPTRLFHLVVEGGPPYWLHLEVPARMRLDELDQFLRNIWLECCGHMSAFKIDGTHYSVSPMDEFEDRDMDVKLEEILHKGSKFSYDYDFGSTTELTIKVASEYEGVSSKKDPIRLLARNDPPPIPCGVCGQPAELVNTEEAWERTGWLCEKCAREREVDEEMCLPVVNSPRVGVCGYTG